MYPNCLGNVIKHATLRSLLQMSSERSRPSQELKSITVIHSYLFQFTVCHFSLLIFAYNYREFVHAYTEEPCIAR